MCRPKVIKTNSVYGVPQDLTGRTFFTEIISTISDCKFSIDGRYMITRDYLALKIWDLNMESRPVKVINVHEHLKPKLCDLYENDAAFDKFECTFSGDAKYDSLNAAKH